MNKRFRQLLVTTTLAITFISALVTAQLAFAADNGYDMQVILPLTGGASFLGKGEQETLKILEKTVNQEGGIHGRPLHFVYLDDQSNPQTAVQLASQVIASRPKVILGSAIVAMCNAMAPLMQRGPVMYCLSPGIHPKPRSFIFTSNVSTKDLASTQIRYFRMKGWKKIALITSTDASGQDAERNIKEILARPENKDVTLVDNEHFNPTDVSVSTEIEHIKASKPDAVIAWSSGAPIGTVFRAMRQADLHVPVATTNANQTMAQMTQYASFMPRQLFIPSSGWPEESSSQPEIAKALARFHGAYKAAGIAPDVSASLAWDPAMLVVDALRHLDANVSTEQLRNYLGHLKGYAGISGIYDFDKKPQRGLDESDSVVTRWDPAAKTWKIVSKPTGTPL